VSDDGPGIPLAERARVFDRFYRGAGVQPPGSGLGLAIVRTIADGHGATVTLADGAGGRGLSVRVSFPRDPSAQPA
jgi:signal transduction histidine kinase